MVDPATLSGTLASLKAASELVSSLIRIGKDSELQAQAMELNQKILDVQRDLFEIQNDQFKARERIQELEKALKSREDWEEIKDRYKLVSPWGNASFVYAVKESYRDHAPAHWACPNCYDNHQASVLSQDKKDRSVVLVCSKCPAKINTQYSGINPPEYVPD